jgi:hypothetical protein
MVIERSSPKVGTVGEQQAKAQPMKKEDWTPSKLKEVLTPARP